MKQAYEVVAQSGTSPGTCAAIILLTDPPFLNPLYVSLFLCSMPGHLTCMHRSIYNCNLRGQRECQVIQPDTVLKTSQSDSQCAWSSWCQLIHKAAFAAAHCDSRDLPIAEVSWITGDMLGEASRSLFTTCLRSCVRTSNDLTSLMYRRHEITLYLRASLCMGK